MNGHMHRGFANKADASLLCLSQQSVGAQVHANAHNCDVAILVRRPWQSVDAQLHADGRITVM